MLQTIVNGHHSFSLEKEDGPLLINNAPAAIAIQKNKSGIISVLLDGKSYEAYVEKIDRDAKEVKLRIDDQRFTISIKEPIDQLLRQMGLDSALGKKAEALKAPMPGMILKILVQEGQEIKKGEGLLILEAMKMENVLKAAADARVKTIKIAEKTAVEKGTVLLEFE
ncbi:MAG: biotin/lipoyl-binding protein [Bacteroidetes bacterium]|nr:biotin/lipoyl-binding protein [Bacteroidota bacterium]